MKDFDLYYRIYDPNQNLPEMLGYYWFPSFYEAYVCCLYLVKYNSGDFIAARNILVSQLSVLINDNQKYFHLLSDYEKENLYKSFTNQFEFLNTFLLDVDLKFLEKYIADRHNTNCKCHNSL